ncbi:MAG TPA: mevalonate kinase [Thermoplasmatales archaeon]|nr:mevalonate kinase [Thermoplasmata archaeon]RLF41859.1 MAG: mevalonate kinase [Thermoplasmata archaeon]RLF63212.1 MAG: mevalonate kinase [Thermoplasmata archaeon]HHH84042.1 mevalonate kinase [Thermoplasmatales archaeon]
MAVASVPGKVILIGEHGVVYGQPCLSVAIDLRVGVDIERGKEFSVNGRAMDGRRHTYIKYAIDKLWDDYPLHVTTFSKIPSASGLGSSAAITTATVACLLEMKKSFSLEEVAKKSFEIEYEVQKGGSPNDTSVCTYGSAILLSGEKMDGFIWEISKGERRWFVHHIDAPEMKIVVGMTGIKSKTPMLVKKVKKFVKYSGFARELTERIGTLALEGADDLKNKDFVSLGEKMNEGQNILHTLGASSPELEKLINASLRAGAYGAKLTGAGGGGSMIAITDEPEKVAIAIEKAGGKAIVTSISNEGVKVWN